MGGEKEGVEDDTLPSHYKIANYYSHHLGITLYYFIIVILTVRKSATFRTLLRDEAKKNRTYTLLLQQVNYLTHGSE